MQRLTHSAIAPYRAALLLKQGGKCVLCQRKPAVPCLDHCHSSGVNRGVLCRGCNALLGKIENNAARNGLGNQADLFRYLSAIPQYIVAGQRGGTGTLHPTFRTMEEKRVARNIKAAKTRAAKKEAK